MTDIKPFILIGIADDESREVLAKAFQEHDCPFSYENVSTVEGAHKWLSQQAVQAIIMDKSMALLGNNGTNGLVISHSELPPTITLLHPGDGYPDYLYDSGKIHDWVTVPFELQELYNRVSHVIRKANK
jgi:DNA-binding response OmpR family regulator